MYVYYSNICLQLSNILTYLIIKDRRVLCINNATCVKSFATFLQWGRTPLHEALRRGRDKAVEALLKAGADVNIADKVSYYVPYTIVEKLIMLI